MKKIFIQIIILLSISNALWAQNIVIALSTTPPANTASWGIGANQFNIIANGISPITPSRILVTILSGSAKKCGIYTPTTAPSTNITNAAAKSWIGTAAAALLGQDCILPPGNYEVCVQIYGYKAQNENALLAEKCKTIIIEEKKEEVCSPPNNINPQNEKLFTDKDILKPIVFNWTPFISSARGSVTYQLTVWEVEDGQTNAQAIYNNSPIIQEVVKAQTRYTASPGIFEKRNAKYIWRVVAIDQEGKPLCSTAQSEITTFKVEIPETVAKSKDSLNTPCGNGDFESSILDPNEWTGGYTQINANNNSTYSSPFNNITNPANGNPIDAPIGANCKPFNHNPLPSNQPNENHHVIVSAGFDPHVPMLPRVPASTIPNKFSLRLGNNCPNWGAERVVKKFIVPANHAIYKFMYALVLQVPANHSLTESPSLWVRVYDAGGAPLPNLVYLDPTSTAPMDRAIADYSNPYWKLHKRDVNDATKDLLWREWACAKIDLSTQIGKIVTIEIITNDCAKGAHFGYAYLDNFCVGCDNNPKPDSCCSNVVKIKSSNTNSVSGVAKIDQEFTITPINIKYVSAEIINVEENAMDTSCMKCLPKENWAYNFISHNTTKWNSDPALNASPVNSTSYYPSKLIEWHCNKIGTVKFSFKIALPANAPGCKRTAKVCIRYKFIDINCTPCEKIICYDVK